VHEPARVVARVEQPARASTAARTRRAKNAASIGSSANVQTRARICEAGENAATARNSPSCVWTATVSPGPGAPSTRSIAPRRSRDAGARPTSRARP
jgi:hypothetical protein